VVGYLLWVQVAKTRPGKAEADAVP
jgi:hypothetical protein